MRVQESFLVEALQKKSYKGIHTVCNTTNGSRRLQDRIRIEAIELDDGVLVKDSKAMLEVLERVVVRPLRPDA